MVNIETELSSSPSRHPQNPQPAAGKFPGQIFFIICLMGPFVINSLHGAWTGMNDVAGQHSPFPLTTDVDHQGPPDLLQTPAAVACNGSSIRKQTHENP